MKIKNFFSRIALVLVLAITLTSTVTVNTTASAATDELSRIWVTGFNTSIKIREGEKLTNSLFKKLKIKVKGQTQAGNAVKSVSVKCAEVGNYLHSKNGKVTLHLSVGEVSTSIAIPVKVKAKKLTVKVKDTLPEGQILTDKLLLPVLKVGVTYKDGKKISNFKGYTCKQLGSVVKSSNGKKKLQVAVGAKKKTVAVKVNKIQRIFIGNCGRLSITEGTSVEEIEKSFREETDVYANYAKIGNKKLSTYSVKVTVNAGTVVVTVKYGKFSDKISIPIVAATPAPTMEPSPVPTDEPSVSPSAKPSVSPNPTSTPGGNGGGSVITPIDPVTPSPSAKPSTAPSTEPTVTPTPEYTVTILSNHSTVKLNGSDMKFAGNTAFEVVKAGTKLNLLVTDSSDAQFVRLIDANTGEELSTSKSYDFTVNSDITIMVVFEEVYTVTVKKVGGKGKVSISGNELEFYGDEATVRLIPGRHTLSAVAADGYKVTKWMDANGKDITTNASYTLAIPGNTTYTVVFAEEDKTVTVTYKHADGTVLKTDAVEFGKPLAPPTENIWRADKTFAGWMLNGTLYEGTSTDIEFYANGTKLSEEISALTEAKKDVELTSHYVPNPPKFYTISVEGGTFSEPTDFAGKNSGTFELNTWVTLVAGQAPEGKVFSHWENSSGEIQSYKESWRFLASSDMEAKAVFDDKPAPAKPVVTLDSYKVDLAGYAISFSISCQVPAEYEKLGWGILISTSLTGDQLTYDSGAKKLEETIYAHDRNVSNGGYDATFLNSKPFFDSLTSFPARAYMVVQGSAGTEYFYSSPITVEVRK